MQMAGAFPATALLYVNSRSLINYGTPQYYVRQCAQIEGLLSMCMQSHNLFQQKRPEHICMRELF